MEIFAFPRTVHLLFIRGPAEEKVDWCCCLLLACSRRDLSLPGKSSDLLASLIENMFLSRTYCLLSRLILVTALGLPPPLLLIINLNLNKNAMKYIFFLVVIHTILVDSILKNGQELSSQSGQNRDQVSGTQHKNFQFWRPNLKII